jgi:hypothetical protein
LIKQIISNEHFRLKLNFLNEVKDLNKIAVLKQKNYLLFILPIKINNKESKHIINSNQKQFMVSKH